MRGALKKRNGVLLQDGARIHTSKATKAHLAKRGVRCVENWPARSPDLNPIENLWAILQRKVAARGPADEAQLVKFVQAEWDKIPQRTVDRLVLSFHGRLQKVVKAKGGHIAH